MKLLFVILLTLALAIAEPNPKHYLIETEDTKMAKYGKGNKEQPERGYRNKHRGDRQQANDEEHTDEVNNRWWDMWNFGLGK